jgi:hypothetical protein
MFDDVTVLRIRTPPPDFEFFDEEDLKMQEVIKQKVRVATCRLACIMSSVVIITVGLWVTFRD